MNGCLNQCAICLMDWIKPIELPCKHVFCKGCIILSLEKKQHCPLCRRLYCIPLGRELQSYQNIQNDKTIYKDQQKEKQEILLQQELTLPVFSYNIHVPLNVIIQLNFYENKYIQLVDTALHDNLLFVIDSGTSYCDIYEFTKIQRNEDQQYYYCEAKNIGRGYQLSTCCANSNLYDSLQLMTLRIIRDSQNISNEDEQKIRDLTNQILTLLNENLVIWEMLDLDENYRSLFNEALTGQQLKIVQISDLSLTLLALLKIPEKQFLKLYYGENILDRLKIIKKHFVALERLNLTSQEEYKATDL